MKKSLFSILMILSLALVADIAHAADQDSDGKDDAVDNCPFNANPDQKDSNYNHIGDICEGDWDGDGVQNDQDNCWDLPNPADAGGVQADLDGDGAGDACDIDRDGDGLTNDFEATKFCVVIDEVQKCLDPDNWDTDGDNVTDYYDCDKFDSSKAVAPDCDIREINRTPPPDIAPHQDLSDPDGDNDHDGVLNRDDNCRDIYNPSQADQDEDGKGDACDNAFDINPELLFLQGGGGTGCSFVPSATSNGLILYGLLFGLPGLILRALRRQK